jgi:hypothetical protein
MKKLLIAGLLSFTCIGAHAGWNGSLDGWSNPTKISSGALSCSYTPVTSGTQGTLYTGATPSASGGTPAYTFSETGSLPTGLSISSSTGIISGTPSVSGTFPSIQVKVTDSTTTVANCGSAFTLTIAASGSGCTESAAFLSGITTAYTTAYQTMICGMVTDGDFAKLDRLYIHATDSTAAALKDIITATSATITGTATFTTNTSYTPTGNATLNTGLNYSTATNYKTSSAMLMAGTLGGATADNNCPIGEAAPSFDINMQVFSFGGGMGGAINGVGFATGTAGTASGLFAGDLSGTTLTNYYNGATNGSATGTPSAPNNTTAQGWQCAGSGSTYLEPVFAVAVGGSLGSAGQLRVFNRIYAFVHTVNPTVFP